MPKEEMAKDLAALAIGGLNSTLNVFIFVLRKTFMEYTTAWGASTIAGRATGEEPRSIEHAITSMLDCVNKIRMSTDVEKLEARARRCSFLISQLYPMYLERRVSPARKVLFSKKNPAYFALMSLNTLAQRYREVSIYAILIAKDVPVEDRLKKAIQLLEQAFSDAMKYRETLKLELEYRPLINYNYLNEIQKQVLKLEMETASEEVNAR